MLYPHRPASCSEFDHLIITSAELSQNILQPVGKDNVTTQCVCVSPSKNQIGRPPIEWLEFHLEFTKQAILLYFLSVCFDFGLVWFGLSR